MTQPVQSKPRRLRRAAIVAVIGGMAVFAMAETVVVKKSAAVLSDKNPFAQPVEQVDSTMKLEVIGREGGWIHVRTPSGKEGYISKTKFPSAASAGGLTGTSDATGAEAAAAGRGLQPETEKYASLKGLSPKDAQQVVDWGDAITDDELQLFGAEGHVGPGKFRK